MNKYMLSYVDEKNEKKAIELKKLDCLSGLDVGDLKIIDNFTMKFDKTKDLLDFLKYNEVIPKNVTKICITKETSKGLIPIDRGYKIFLKKDEVLTTSLFYKYFKENINNYDLIKKLCKEYIEKYNKYIEILKTKNNAEKRIIEYENEIKFLKNTVTMAYNIEKFSPTDRGYKELEPTLLERVIRLLEKELEDGSYKRKHDFISIMKELDKDKKIYRYKFNSSDNNIEIFDNHIIQHRDCHEEYLTEEEQRTMNM